MMWRFTGGGAGLIYQPGVWSPRELWNKWIVQNTIGAHPGLNNRRLGTILWQRAGEIFQARSLNIKYSLSTPYRLLIPIQAGTIPHADNGKILVVFLTMVVGVHSNYHYCKVITQDEAKWSIIRFSQLLFVSNYLYNCSRLQSLCCDHKKMLYWKLKHNFNPQCWNIIAYLCLNRYLYVA